MAVRTVGYGPEQSDRDVARLDTVIDGMIKHLAVFDQKKVAAEDFKRVEGYKNEANAIARGINIRLECLVTAGRTEAQRQALEEKGKQKRKTA